MSDSDSLKEIINPDEVQNETSGYGRAQIGTNFNRRNYNVPSTSGSTPKSALRSEKNNLAATKATNVARNRVIIVSEPWVRRDVAFTNDFLTAEREIRVVNPRTTTSLPNRNLEARQQFIPDYFQPDKPQSSFEPKLVHKKKNITSKRICSLKESKSNKSATGVSASRDNHISQEYIQELRQESHQFMNCQDSICLMKRGLNPMNIEGFPYFKAPLNLTYLRQNSSATLQNGTIRFKDPLHVVISERHMDRPNLYSRSRELISCLKKPLEPIPETSQATSSFKSKLANTLQFKNLVRRSHGMKLNAFRNDKFLLVLDLNGTLCDYPTWPLTDYPEGKRPFLHEFLCFAYCFYDIAIWSCNTMDIIIHKLVTMNVLSNRDYTIALCLDNTCCMSANIPTYGYTKVKPLELIWRLYKQYNHTNTIFVDDQIKNFYYSRDNGVLVESYHSRNYETDRELRLLMNYLKKLLKKKGKSNTPLDHKNWKNNLQN